MDDASRIGSSSNCNGEPGVWIAKVSCPILKPKPRAVLRVEGFSGAVFHTAAGSVMDLLGINELKYP